MITRGQWWVRDGRLGVWDGHVHTAIFKIDNQQGPTVEHRELSPIVSSSLKG